MEFRHHSPTNINTQRRKKSTNFYECFLFPTKIRSPIEEYGERVKISNH